MSDKQNMLGEILVQLGIVTPEQLAFALQEQAKTPGVKLGQVLVQFGYCTPQQIMSAISRQLGFTTLGEGPAKRRKGYVGKV